METKLKTGRERLEDFLRGKNPNTAKGYEIALKHYFFSIYGDNSLSLEDEKKAMKSFDLEEAVDKYFSEKDRDYRKDVQNFLYKYQKRQGTTFGVYKVNVKMFLSRNDVVIPDYIFKDVKVTKQTKEKTQDIVPSLSELREIMDNLPPQGKALCAMLSSSGMRIGECLSLELDDIKEWFQEGDGDNPHMFSGKPIRDFNRIPSQPLVFQLRAKDTKTSTKRIVIISTEAVGFLKAWLAYRDEYLKIASKRSAKYEKSIEDERIFCFDNATTDVIWESALKKCNKAQRDENTNRLLYHYHGLRKFFRTRSNFDNRDVAEVLMGHQSQLNEIYARLSDDIFRLYSAYQKIEQNLTVYKIGNGVDVKKLRAEFEEQIKENKESNEEQQKLVNTLSAQLMKTMNIVETLDKENKRIVGIMDAMKEDYGAEIEKMRKAILEDIENLIQSKDFEKMSPEDVEESTVVLTEEQAKEEVKKLEKSP